MNDPKLGPLAPDLIDFLEAEKGRAVDGADRVDRILGRVRASLIVPSGGGGGSGAGGGGHGTGGGGHGTGGGGHGTGGGGHGTGTSGAHGAGGVGPFLDDHTGSPPQDGISAPLGVRWGPVGAIAFTKIGAAVTGAFAVGAVAGAAGHARLAKGHDEMPAACVDSSSAMPRSRLPVSGANPSEADSVPVELPSAPAAAPGTAEGTTDSHGPGSTLAALPVAHAPASSASIPLEARDVDLARERALVDMARSALARGSSTSAIAALRSHERLFPTGRLTEEREAMLIQVLASSGQGDEAMRRAAMFRSRFPGSMLLAAVDNSVAGVQVDGGAGP